MKPFTLQFTLAIAALATLFTASAAHAQVSFTGSYNANASFSAMGTGTAVPTGWTGLSEAGTHYTFEPAGDYNGTGTATTAANPNLTAGALTTSPMEYLVPTQASGTGKGVDIVNFQNTLATAQNGEASESLGTDPSGNAATILELSLNNSTGAAINSVNVSYDIDRFTTISDTNGAPAGYPNSSVEEFPGYQLFYNLTPSNAATWVNVSALNPTINMGTTGTVNVPNTVGITTASATINLASAWGAGQTIGFAWLDDNGEAPSPDQEIGLNNVLVAAVPEPNAGLLGLVAMGVAFIAVRLRKQRSA